MTFRMKYLLAFLLSPSLLYAATPIDLAKNPTAAALATQQLLSSAQLISRSQDFNHVTHQRMQQYYQSFPVRGADYVVHIKGNHKTMNGIVYADLPRDLLHTKVMALTKAALDNAFQKVVQLSGLSNATLSHEVKQIIIYLDTEHRAHYGYYITFYAQKGKDAEAPIYIINADTNQVYKSGSAFRHLDDIGGGTVGGNPRNKITYDGTLFPGMREKRDAATQTCYLSSDYGTIYDPNNNYDIVHYRCPAPVKGRLYWNFDGELTFNMGYAPGEDALFAVNVTTHMFNDNYGISPWRDTAGKAKPIAVWLHGPSNYAWYDEYISIWDGDDTTSYPESSLQSVAHEIGHGFTFEHSHLDTFSYFSSALDEAFGDMTAKAVEFYLYGRVIDWNIGNELMDGTKWQRYMDLPSKDCYDGQAPGDSCSINSYDQIGPNVPQWYFMGVFNRAFYFLATTNGWDVKKAYDVMKKANEDYWTSNMEVCPIAEGAVKAAKDYQYDTTAVIAAFKKVGIDTALC
jgi:pseudolysin